METSSPTVLKMETTFSPLNSDIRVVTQPEGLVLLHVRNGMFYRANHVGTRIWEKLMTGICLNEVVKQIAGEFGVPLTTVAPDVFEFVNSLLTEGFLRLEDHQ